MQQKIIYIYITWSNSANDARYLNRKVYFLLDVLEQGGPGGRSSAGAAGMRVFSERARTFLLLFRFDFTENRMARWRTYSELVINPWKPPTRGLLEESPTLWFFIYFLHCLILKIVWGYCSQKGRHCHASHTWYYAQRLNFMLRRLWPTVLCLYDVLPRISHCSAASEDTMEHNIILRTLLKQP